ncbi:MAG: hypothetical protein PUB00_06165 [Clostridiales bacterium]|nr:hypothetical protein [Clostridiales bacterium]
MNEKKKRIGRLIAYILLSVLFAAISVFFIMVLVSSNDTFFNRTASQSKFSVPDIMIGVIIAAIVVMAVLSVTMRKKFVANKAILYGVGGIALLGAVTFMILLSVLGPFEIAFENANLYVMYFLFVVLANAYVIFAAIRNILKSKKEAVVFAKSLSDSKSAETDASES